MAEVQLFWTFLKIGCTAFGGFMALIAVVQSTIVEKLSLITEDELLEGISIASILPGPMAVNVVSYAGYKIGGLGGALAATTGVILPSFILMLTLSHVYLTYQDTSVLLNIFSGILPAVVAIIIVVSLNLSKKNLNILPDYIFAIVSALVLYFFKGFYVTVLIIMVSGLIGAFVLHNTYVSNVSNKASPVKKVESPTRGKKVLIISTSVLILFVIVLAFYGDQTLKDLFFSFGKMSTTLFGGGYVFIPMMEDLIVNQMEWMSAREFADSIALGQITPGPILISATFIGYKVKGLVGATIASIGMFMPPAIIIIVVSHYFDKIKHIARLQSAIRSIKSSVVGMIFIAAMIIGKNIQWDYTAVIILILSFILFYFYRVSVLYIIPLAGVIGFVIKGVL